MNNLQAINKFMMFSLNYKHYFIEEVWGVGSSMAVHLRSKFATCYEKHGSLGVMTAFYIELDCENRDLLMHYVLGQNL